MVSRTAPKGLFLVAVFFGVSACVVFAVGTALLLPGTSLEHIWAIYPARRALLMPYRTLLGPLFLCLGVAMSAASLGCFLHRRWGWWLAVLIFAANGCGDVIQLSMGKFLEGAIGVVAAGAILFYLTRPTVRAAIT